jgi:hypothetical protein
MKTVTAGLQRLNIFWQEGQLFEHFDRTKLVKNHSIEKYWWLINHRLTTG